MPRPKAIDDDKRSTICSLVASGVSLRQAAHYIGCAPRSIRREISRNGQFRASLAKAKSEAGMHPLESLRQAAKTNWRAALAWMERLDPDRFADPTESIVTKREANRFVDNLIVAIGETVESPRDRRDLLDLLGTVMPPAMRRRWEGDAMNQALEQMRADVEERNRIRADRINDLRADRDRRRSEVFQELAAHLPREVRSKLWEQRDLLDPEEVFADQREQAACADMSADSRQSA